MAVTAVNAPPRLAALPNGKCIGHPSNDPARIVIVTCDDIIKASSE
jgi:hypothetical protein